MQTPQGTVSTIYMGYENVDGILFPSSMKQTVGPQMFEIEVKSVEVNSGIDDSRFEVK
jgi:outer membrane lipoprotein-sorting protein